MSRYERTGSLDRLVIEETRRGVAIYSQRVDRETAPSSYHVLPDADRVKAAQALAGDKYEVVPADTIDGTMQHDLERILAVLGLPTHGRDGVSLHQAVDREVLPAIKKLKAADDSAIADLVNAIRLTVEYVGTDTLPPIPGWSWYDALQRHAPDVAKQFREAADRVAHLTITPEAKSRIDAKQEAALSAADPEPIDPADVRVGDVVEYERRPGYEPCRILGEVRGIKLDFASINIHGHWWNAAPGMATVRLVSRPEPEPDPEQAAYRKGLEWALSKVDDLWSENQIKGEIQRVKGRRRVDGGGE